MDFYIFEVNKTKDLVDYQILNNTNNTGYKIFQSMREEFSLICQNIPFDFSVSAYIACNCLIPPGKTNSTFTERNQAAFVSEKIRFFKLNSLNGKTIYDYDQEAQNPLNFFFSQYFEDVNFVELAVICEACEQVECLCQCCGVQTRDFDTEFTTFFNEDLINNWEENNNNSDYNYNLLTYILQARHNFTMDIDSQHKISVILDCLLQISKKYCHSSFGSSNGKVLMSHIVGSILHYPMTIENRNKFLLLVSNPKLLSNYEAKDIYVYLPHIMSQDEWANSIDYWFVPYESETDKSVIYNDALLNTLSKIPNLNFTLSACLFDRVFVDVLKKDFIEEVLAGRMGCGIEFPDIVLHAVLRKFATMENIDCALINKLAVHSPVPFMMAFFTSCHNYSYDNLSYVERNPKIPIFDDILKIIEPDNLIYMWEKFIREYQALGFNSYTRRLEYLFQQSSITIIEHIINSMSSEQIKDLMCVLTEMLHILPHRPKNDRYQGERAKWMEKLCSSSIVGHNEAADLVINLINEYIAKKKSTDRFNRNDYAFVFPTLLENEAVKFNKNILQIIWDLGNRRSVVRHKFASMVVDYGKGILPIEIYDALSLSSDSVVQEILKQKPIKAMA